MASGLSATRSRSSSRASSSSKSKSNTPSNINAAAPFFSLQRHIRLEYNEHAGWYAHSFSPRSEKILIAGPAMLCPPCSASLNMYLEAERSLNMRQDIEFNAEGTTLRGWLYTPD